MKIVCIFAPHLYAVKYNNEDFDELERLFDAWDDIEKLESFFEDNAADLTYFNLNIEEAIVETWNEARALRKTILGVVEEQNPNLDAIFKNLNNEEIRCFELTKQKTSRRWLRIYAIRIDKNVYLITGGAIKLTRKMKDRQHTLDELNKLEQCRNYLKENHVFDDDSFYDLLSETP